MATLRYRSNVCVGDLEVGECTMHRAANDTGARWWLLWFRVNREDNGQAADFAVPMNPNGGWIEAGPGGKTWGLIRSSPGAWQVFPSINVLGTNELHPGPHEAPSQWHQTPVITDVPEGEAWISSPP
jgi:hypothetical protein